MFELLRDKNILAILDGDEIIDRRGLTYSKEYIEISMPYLSGPELCDISNRFGLPVTYVENRRRWAYLDDLLVHCIKNYRVSELLGFLFSKGQFVEKLKGHPHAVIEAVYTEIVETVIGKN